MLQTVSLPNSRLFAHVVNMGMKQTEFLKALDEKPLRMAVEPELPRPQIVIRQATSPVPASDNLLPALVIMGFACWLVYAFMRTIPA